MATLFKDFSKDAKDLLNKNHTAAGQWKLESKLKGGAPVVFNPKADKKGVNVDMEYTCGTCDVTAKVNVASNGAVKPKLTKKKDGAKYELAYAAGDVTGAFEFNHPTWREAAKEIERSWRA